MRKGIQVNFIGDKTGLPKDILAMMKYSERITKDKTKVYLNIAVNYGGRQEIVHSVQELAKQVKKGKLKPDDITEDMISDNFTRQVCPTPIDNPSKRRETTFKLLALAGGLCGVLVVGCAVADFSEEDLVEALRNFEKRNRRFGGI